MNRNAGRALVVIALGLTAAGCAKREPPSGGPPDLEAPRVIASAPDSGAAHVARDAELSLTFSEGMEPRSTGDAVALAPRAEIRQRRWHGRTLTVVLAESLKAHQTYTMFLGSGARDLHGNHIGGGRTIVFSTADSFPPGVLAGRVEARGFNAGGIYLWCYAEGRKPDSTARDFDALGVTDAAGDFRISGLPVPAPYHLWAFADLNQNRSFEPATDLLAPVDTSFDLTRAAPRAEGVMIRVVNPRAPGHVRGTVLDSLADSLGVVRLTAVAERDTSRTLIFDADPDLRFDLTLPPGNWRVRAFRDHDRNRGWQSASEPASDLERLTVPPAGDSRVLQLVLRRPKAREGSP
ncbi:MAG TPA: Ig-like domain-containing protein [Candidatus Saccharimonadaceae bacterium]|nr:Ig-like domain-containing protein [Candidatus Saccharimonadaceae bacterium]